MDGKNRRLCRIFGYDKKTAIIVPLDDSLIDGVASGLLRLGEIANEIAASEITGVLGYIGLLNQPLISSSSKATILNVSGSTSLGEPLLKRRLFSVQHALRMGADGVAFHINFGNKYTDQMIREAAETSELCDQYGVPLVLFAYLRRERDGHLDDYTDLAQKEPPEYRDKVAHAIRVCVELGADAIKVSYLGKDVDFGYLVEAASGVPLLLAGGPKIDDQRVWHKRVEGALSSGFRGVIAGRNVFQRPPVGRAVQDLVRVIRSVSN